MPAEPLAVVPIPPAARNPPAVRVVPVPRPPRVAPQPVTPPAVIAPVVGSAVDAINAFYGDVTARNFGAAAATWSAHMRAEYPPSIYINDRFAATSFIGLTSARVMAQSVNSATVAVSIVEIYAGTTRHWAGSWQLVRGSSGWLLDQPYLHAA